ncbi:phycobilisome linker polypeptide [[Phormidium ambiguum] IAM M-71]|uniref:Phycobilisome linker polypeptide n=1 Tax=[Phormidium ambiguum] IAM M-71 TaxID=454136 RepID=A0A1U7I717_9CYAN|nr:phycobilisome linker polypeptide [Phormidium ambiguum]OKH32160.1 phycobilisome linker polypeptide [Phormidium ambiguum IAM M-71]
MLGQTAIGSAANTPSGSRVFRYEVVGLRQNDEADKNNYSIRRSGSVFVTVPYNRMNEEMRRIARLGGKIVSIHPMGAEEAAPKKSAKKAEE